MQLSKRDDQTTLVIQQPPAPRSPRARAHRAWRWACDAFWGFIDSFRDPRVADFLPPVPEATLGRSDDTSAAERGERLLLEVLCAPPEYLRGLATVAAVAEQLRGVGPGALEDALVHLALSRIQPDQHGEIPLVWLERKLEGISWLVLTRALRHLDYDDAIEFLPAREGDSGPRFYDELRGAIGRVKLRRPI